MFDVIVVGGGPAGLFLAGELRLAGVRPVVLERLTQPDLDDKAHGLLGQAVRLLDNRGLIERCGGPVAPRPASGFFFAGFPLPLDTLGESSPMYLLPIDQRDLERVFRERAGELGVEVRRGWEMRSFVQTHDGVNVLATCPDGEERTLTARFLVGCDGARSSVRKQAGIGFPGSRDENVVDRWAQVGRSAAFRLLPRGRIEIDGFGEFPAHFHRTEHGVFTLLGRDPAAPILNTAEWEPDPPGNHPGPGTPMTLTEMEDSIERILGVRLPLTPPPAGTPALLRRLSGRNTRLADRYRVGRVFIGGDAAHTSHGPTLNLALQDVANLAWKLAAAVKGWGSDELLDSYETERRPAGEREVMWTQAETALMAPGSDITALRQLFAELLGRRENLRMIAGVMAGADVRYDIGRADPASPTGWFIPPFEVTADGHARRVAELLRDARPILLDLTSTDVLAAVAERWDDRVVRVTATADSAPAPALLIRPDGYLAWAGDDPESLRAALMQWFGTAKPDLAPLDQATTTKYGMGTS